MHPLNSPQQSSAERRPLRMLLVDDDPEYVLLVERALVPSAGPLEIDHVDTFGAALARQERDPADVVLLDLSLPDSPAESTTKHLRHLTRSAVVFVLTVREERSVALEALASGAEDFFIKDQLDPNTLAAVLQNAADRRRRGEARMLDRCMGSDEFRAELRSRIGNLGAGESMSLTIVQLDEFDAQREIWGEPWAHRILRSTAESLSQTAGDTDSIVARMGESSFAVLTSGSRECRLPEIVLGDGDRISASHGTVRVPADGRHSVSLVALAQQRASESFDGCLEGARLRLATKTIDRELRGSPVPARS